MIRISCPHCGMRDHTEFTYGGAVAGERPALTCADETAWFDYVFLRDNPAGKHQEYWQHSAGCRKWLVVTRHTVNHEISSVRFADGEYKP